MYMKIIIVESSPTSYVYLETLDSWNFVISYFHLRGKKLYFKNLGTSEYVLNV